MTLLVLLQLLIFPIAQPKRPVDLEAQGHWQAAVMWLAQDRYEVLSEGLPHNDINYPGVGKLYKVGKNCFGCGETTNQNPE